VSCVDRVEDYEKDAVQVLDTTSGVAYETRFHDEPESLKVIFE
jgi:hypothetical protein